MVVSCKPGGCPPIEEHTSGFGAYRLPRRRLQRLHDICVDHHSVNDYAGLLSATAFCAMQQSLILAIG